MTLDVSLEAIEADLQQAETMSGVGQQVRLIRAQVRATLLAGGFAPPPRVVIPEGMELTADDLGKAARQPAPLMTVTQRQATQLGGGPAPDITIARGAHQDVWTVPHGVDWPSRAEAAAILLGVPKDVLLSLFARGGFEVGGDPLAAPEPAIEAPAEPEVDEDEDDAAIDAEHDAEWLEDTDDDEPEDVFAEAREERRR